MATNVDTAVSVAARKGQIFTMSDGNLVAVYYNGTAWGYRIKASGAWGSRTALTNSPAATGAVWAQNGDTIYGAVTGSGANGFIPYKLAYATGAITQSNTVTGDNVPVLACYIDTTNSRFIVAVQITSAGVYIYGYPLTGTWASSFAALQVTAGSPPATGQDDTTWAAAGNGTGTWQLAWFTTAGSTTFNVVTMVTTTTAITSQTAETSEPALAANCTGLDAIYDGTNVTFVANQNNAALRYTRRTAANTYDSWATLVTETIAGAPSVARKAGSGDLLVAYRSNASQANGEIATFRRLSGTWDTSKTTLAGAASTGWTSPRVSVGDTTTGVAPVAYLTGTANPWTLVEDTVTIATSAVSQTVTAVPADGTGDLINPAVTAGATVTSPPADGTGDLVAPAVTGSGTPILTFDGTGATWVRFDWPEIDFQGPFSLGTIHRMDESPSGEVDKWLLSLIDVDNVQKIWHMEHSGGPVNGGEFSVFSGLVGGGHVGVNNDATLDPYGKSWEMWFTWSGATTDEVQFHWRNLTDAPATWHHSTDTVGSGNFSTNPFADLLAKLFVGGTDGGGYGGAPFIGAIGAVFGAAVDLWDGGSGPLASDPLHTSTSDIQAMLGSNIRFGADLTSDNPGDILDLAGLGVVCDQITGAVLTSGIPEFTFNGALTGVLAPPADGTGDLIAPTVTAGSTLVTPPADGTGDGTNPAVTAGATVASPPIDGTGAFPPLNQQLSSEVTTPTADATGTIPAPAVTGGSGAVDATVTAVPADGTGALPVPTVTAGASVTTPPADGTGGLPAPAVTAGANVTSPPAAGTGALAAPAVTAGSSVTSPPADATGQFPAPTVSASGSATTTTPAADGTGTLPPPTVTGNQAATVTTPPAAGTGAALPPTITAGASVTTIPADGTGTAPAPAVTAGASVVSPPADGTGQAPPPVVAGTVITVEAPPADGTGALPAPAVTTVYVFAPIAAGQPRRPRTGHARTPRTGQARRTGVRT